MEVPGAQRRRLLRSPWQEHTTPVPPVQKSSPHRLHFMNFIFLNSLYRWILQMVSFKRSLGEFRIFFKISNPIHLLGNRWMSEAGSVSRLRSLRGLGCAGETSGSGLRKGTAWLHGRNEGNDLGGGQPLHAGQGTSLSDSCRWGCYWKCLGGRERNRAGSGALTRGRRTTRSELRPWLV